MKMSILYNYIRRSHILAIIEDAKCKKSPSINLTCFDVETVPGQLFECCEIERLYLHGNKIKVLDPKVSQLVNITTLTIDYNELTSLPEEIGQLANLQNLNISHNPLKKLPPQIGQLQKLEVLWCNGIDAESLPEELGLLTELDTFGARGNKIRQLPKSFTNLKKLRWLTLENNLLNKLPHNMNQLERLVHLNIQRNQLTSLPSSTFLCRHIQYIFIGNNQIADASLCGDSKLNLSSMKRLVYIDIRENPFTNNTSFRTNIKDYPKLKLNDEWKPVGQVIANGDTTASREATIDQNNEVQSQSFETRVLSNGNSSDGSWGTEGMEAVGMARSIQVVSSDLASNAIDVEDNSIADEMASVSDGSSESSGDDWENSFPSSQLDSTDHSDQDFEENEVVGNYLPELSKFIGTGS